MRVTFFLMPARTSKTSASVALGTLSNRLHVLCFTEADDGIRVISFRKANYREVARYAKFQTPG
ncbi:MAG: BrnT family toxin [Rubrivivax sp.]